MVPTCTRTYVYYHTYLDDRIALTNMTCNRIYCNAASKRRCQLGFPPCVTRGHRCNYWLEVSQSTQFHRAVGASAQPEYVLFNQGCDCSRIENSPKSYRVFPVYSFTSITTGPKGVKSRKAEGKAVGTLYIYCLTAVDNPSAQVRSTDKTLQRAASAATT